jgi:membrane-associated phospholipid phosphatase
MGLALVRDRYLLRATIFLLTLFCSAHCALYASGSSGQGGQDQSQEPQDSKASPPALASPTSLNRFPQDLAGNFFAIFGKSNLKPLIIGAAATGVAATVDDEVRGHFKDRNHSTAAANIGSYMGKPYVLVPAVGGLLVARHYSGDERFRSYTYALAQAYTIDLAMAGAIKVAVRRERPDGSNNRAFPSGHASDYFTIATVTYRYYGRTAGIIGYAVAGYVSFSRVLRDVHWTSDIVAGATLGYIVGNTVCRKAGVMQRSRRITLLPATDPARKAVGLNLYLTLR